MSLPIGRVGFVHGESKRVLRLNATNKCITRLLPAIDVKDGLVWEKSVDRAHLDLRFEVLREGLPRGSEHYPGIDEDARTRFLCAYEGGRLVGCSTLQTDEREGCRFRIRGMAVSPDFRNRGIGSRIVKRLQQYASEQGTGIWCNARIRAVPMYKRYGFVEVSDVFEIEGIGLHYDMEWK